MNPNKHLSTEKKDSTEPFPSTSRESDNLVKTLLIAEDVRENYFLLKVLLGKQYRIIHATNGEEVIQLYTQHHPDLILMDIKMPVMDGFEATRQIRKMSTKIPIIALTAFAFEEDKEIARNCLMTDYLVKPIEISLLRKTLDKYLKE